MGGYAGDVGSATGCCAVTVTSVCSQLVRGENADSGAFGFAGSFVDIGS